MILKEKVTVVYKYLKITFYSSIFAIVTISCSEEITVNYRDLFLRDGSAFSTANGTYLAFSVQRGEDVRFVVYPSYNLKIEMLRFGDFTHSNYKAKLIDAIEKNFPLEVSDSLFNYFECHSAFVNRNKGIDSIFNAYNNDVVKILNEVVCYESEPSDIQIIKSWGDAEWMTDGYFQYLVYLLFQYDFYVYPDEETGVDFIVPESEGYGKKRSVYN